jgi:hypothetical protein
MNSNGASIRPGFINGLRRFLNLWAHIWSPFFFDVDGGEEAERKGADDWYTLRIDLLHSTEEDPVAAREAAEKDAASISAAFRERCVVPGKGWQWIELLGCEPISDQAMTYLMSTQLKRWNMDYLSLRADPPAEPIQNN